MTISKPHLSARLYADTVAHFPYLPKQDSFLDNSRLLFVNLISHQSKIHTVTICYRLRGVKRANACLEYHHQRFSISNYRYKQPKIFMNKHSCLKLLTSAYLYKLPYASSEANSVVKKYFYQPS